MVSQGSRKPKASPIGSIPAHDQRSFPLSCDRHLRGAHARARVLPKTSHLRCFHPTKFHSLLAAMQQAVLARGMAMLFAKDIGKILARLETTAECDLRDAQFRMVG